MHGSDRGSSRDARNARSGSVVLLLLMDALETDEDEKSERKVREQPSAWRVCVKDDDDGGDDGSEEIDKGRYGVYSCTRTR